MSGSWSTLQTSQTSFIHDLVYVVIVPIASGLAEEMGFGLGGYTEVVVWLDRSSGERREAGWNGGSEERDDLPGRTGVALPNATCTPPKSAPLDPYLETCIPSMHLTGALFWA